MDYDKRIYYAWAFYYLVYLLNLFFLGFKTDDSQTCLFLSFFTIFYKFEDIIL